MEVPTVMSFSSLQQSTAEQIIEIPVPHGRGRVVGRCLQDLRPEQSSTAVAEQNVDTSVPRRGGSRGGLQGFSPGQRSTQRTVTPNDDLPVPGPRPSRGFPPGQGLLRTVERIIDIHVSRLRDDGGLPDVELEARLEAELEELLAISAASGLSPQQQDRLDEVHREIARM